MRVMAVMLANGRQAMVNRAIASFQSQSYPDKVLHILDTSPEPLAVLAAPGVEVTCIGEHSPKRTLSIGELRNVANTASHKNLINAEIICNWDSDDWSAPTRIAEQVEFLQASGAEAVGYRDMLFWRDVPATEREVYGTGSDRVIDRVQEAWYYRCPNPAYCLGTSLLYARDCWEKKPFAAKNIGEDTEWMLRVKTVAVSSIAGNELRMVAAIHGGNTSSKIIPSAQEWKRAPQYDDLLRSIMRLP